MSNKRTTESEVGFLSKLVSTLYIRKAEAILRRIDEEEADADIAIDHRAVQAMSKWVIDNGVYASPDAAAEDSPLQARLRAIQERSGNKVIDFKKEYKETGEV